MKVRLIPRPSWALPESIEFEEDGKRAQKILAAVENEAAALVQQAVSDYLHDDNLVFAGEVTDAFPRRSKLTGDYYLGRRVYGMGNVRNESVAFVSIMARCLERLERNDSDGQDYLGLDVTIVQSEATKRLEIYAVDSSSI